MRSKVWANVLLLFEWFSEGFRGDFFENVRIVFSDVPRFCDKAAENFLNFKFTDELEGAKFFAGIVGVVISEKNVNLFKILTEAEFRELFILLLKTFNIGWVTNFWSEFVFNWQ